MASRLRSIGLRTAYSTSTIYSTHARAAWSRHMPLTSTCRCLHVCGQGDWTLPVRDCLHEARFVWFSCVPAPDAFADSKMCRQMIGVCAHRGRSVCGSSRGSGVTSTCAGSVCGGSGGGGSGVTSTCGGQRVWWQRVVAAVLVELLARVMAVRCFPLPCWGALSVMGLMTDKCPHCRVQAQHVRGPVWLQHVRGPVWLQRACQ